MKRIFVPNSLIITLSITLIIWFAIFSQGITTAYTVWLTSEIFNHCVLIIPISLYLIYEKWGQLTAQPQKPNYLLLLPILVLCVIQLFAQIGDVKILMHLASFIALPLMIWFSIGNRAAKTIMFPLFFILFAIPIGDQLIPHLQEITTDIAVPLLNWSQVPVYRNGLYLDIPEGRFLVAEACSGISFLITTLAFGCLYSYLFFKQRKRQIIFIAASLLIPIAANAIRVYGIILTGHLTNMEHAVGADHLIYGGVFFGFVLLLLLGFGELIKEKTVKSAPNSEPVANLQTAPQQGSFIKPTASLLVVSAFFHLWLSSADKTLPIAPQAGSTGSLYTYENKDILADWHVNLGDKLTITQGVISSPHSALTADYQFIGGYSDGQNGKLVSSTYREFVQQQWVLVSRKSTKISGEAVIEYQLTSPTGKKKVVYKWLKIGGKKFINANKAKLYTAWLKMWSKPAHGTLYMFSPVTTQNKGASEINPTHVEQIINQSLVQVYQKN